MIVVEGIGTSECVYISNEAVLYLAGCKVPVLN